MAKLHMHVPQFYFAEKQYRNKTKHKQTQQTNKQTKTKTKKKCIRPPKLFETKFYGEKSFAAAAP